ncbi:hypothetical protein IMCC21906_01923 [Spongiibacter sp. IMCC21906]|jgi:predicted small lipoprotein YifL|uniref:hypothetical protein n=1 Tax=Spongiibacter sp. IMCC21906 TaxID=1620392 RepID=UPI00062DF380|nr:hypothetical protein [Spongiibacter sp. IMCC21906]AKH69597.1 hypothetical protein IMCC21906_01923 [Spongiibacter sp. IMCC21906]
MKRNSENTLVSMVSRYLLVAIIAGAGLFTITACEEKGPMEEAGESIDQGMDDMGDSMDEGAEEISDEYDDHTTN